MRHELHDHIADAFERCECAENAPAAIQGSGQTLGVDRHRRLLVQPDPVFRRALKLLAALIEGFQTDGADTAALMLDGDRIKRSCHTRPTARLTLERFQRDQTSAELAPFPLAANTGQNHLNDVASGFRRIAGCPGADRMIYPPAWPPVRIVAGQMQRGLIPANAEGLANTIGGDDRPFLLGKTRCKQLEKFVVFVPRKRSIRRIELGNPVSVLSPLQFLRDLPRPLDRRGKVG